MLPELLAAFHEHERLVIEAEPGAGKTTRLPHALLESGTVGGEILVLEPRRLAARSAAAYVARRLGEPLGRRCGYRVRFDAAVSSETRLCFQTEGLLARRLRDDPDLVGVGAVLLDEFHERHVATDLALGLLRLAQARRREGGVPLRLALLSATFDGAGLAARLDARHVRVPGRSHPVSVEHLGPEELLPRRGEREAPRLETLVARAVRRLLREGVDGHILVFVPGLREIGRAADACAELAREAGLLVLPLHGALPPAEQDRALAPSTGRKLLLATNVAETSLTIDGVVAVIDSGLARTPSHDPFSGLPRLVVAKVSRASAAQRAGRAGRTRPGRCLRLYTREDHDARPERDAPEALRLELSEALLELHGAGVADAGAFPWLDPPPAAALEAAEALLRRLGAVDGASGRLSETGREMLRFPLHPRLARLVVEAERLGIGALGVAAAALLGERRIRGPAGAERRASADLLLDLEDLDAVARHAATAASLGLDPAACRRVAQGRRQLEGLLRRVAPHASRPAEPALPAEEETLCRALLVAFPDRVAKARSAASGERALALAGGGAAVLARESAVRDAEWLLCLDAEERPSGPGTRTFVRSAAAIAPEWLLEAFPERVEETRELAFDPVRERVEGRSALRFDGLMLAESPLRPLPSEASALLREAALAAGPEALSSAPGALAELFARTELASTLDPTQPRLDAAAAREALARLCEGRTSFAELREADLGATLEATLGGDGRARLERLAPREVALPGRRRVRVRYEAGKPPWIESRLQDFFGLEEGPRVGGGRVPLVLHLLAPNGRAVQVTTDLAGFWERHYPALRRQLERRYPRHAWPVDPLRATPPRR